MNLRHLGYTPDFVVDVGAGNGWWSYHAHLVYPKPRYVLIEPLLEEYKRPDIRKDYLIDHFPHFELVEAAVSNHEGEAMLNVADDVASSSFYPIGARLVKKISVPCRTLAGIAAERKLAGRGLMKLDIQFAEHLAFSGAGAFLDQIDIIVAEVSLYRFSPAAKTYLEILNLLHDRGFEYFDDAGEYRKGILMCKDVVFAREELASRLFQLANSA